MRTFVVFLLPQSKVALFLPRSLKQGGSVYASVYATPACFRPRTVSSGCLRLLHGQHQYNKPGPYHLSVTPGNTGTACTLPTMRFPSKIESMHGHTIQCKCTHTHTKLSPCMGTLYNACAHIHTSNMQAMMLMRRASSTHCRPDHRLHLMAPLPSAYKHNRFPILINTTAPQCS